MYRYILCTRSRSPGRARVSEGAALELDSHSGHVPVALYEYIGYESARAGARAGRRDEYRPVTS